jgi:hypothetical protein
MTDPVHSSRTLVVLGAVVGLWGVLTIPDVGKRATAGYRTDGNNTVLQVDEESPAAASGLRAGDRVRRINDIPAEDAAGLARLGRATVGESRAFVVERAGHEVTLDITYARLSVSDRHRSWAGILVGFCYLGFCMAAWLTKRDRATRLLAVMGIGVGLAFLAGPYFEAAGVRSVVNTIRNALILAGMAATLHFLLVFPAPRPFIERPGGVKLLYAPALAFWLLISYRVLFTPAATRGLNTLTNVFAGVIVGGYLLLGIITLLRRYIRASAGERRSRGLNTMLGGTILGLAPLALGHLVAVLAPRSRLPGQDVYFLSLVFIPLTWSLAARR